DGATPPIADVRFQIEIRNPQSAIRNSWRARAKPFLLGNDLAPGDGPHRLPGLQIDVLGNKVDGPVGLEDVYAPGGPAPRGGGHLVHAAAATGQVEVGPVVRGGAEPRGRSE